MKQHTVPQNIMSVEFKIFGDLSIRQFIYVSITGGLAFIFYLTLLPALIKYSLIGISLIIGILITFAKVNERPFDQWINSFITAVMLPTQRIWKKTDIPPAYIIDVIPTMTDTQPKNLKENSKYSKVINYLHSKRLPTDDVYKSNTKLDIEEIKMLTSIDKIFSQSKKDNITKRLNSIDLILNSAGNEDIVASQLEPRAIEAKREEVTLAPIATMPLEDKKEILQKIESPVTSPIFTSPPLADLSNQQVANLTIQPDDQGISDDVSILPVQGPSMDNEKKKNQPNEDIFTIEPNTVVKLDELKTLSSNPVDELDAELKSIAAAVNGTVIKVPIRAGEEKSEEVVIEPADLGTIPTAELSPEFKLQQENKQTMEEVSAPVQQVQPDASFNQLEQENKLLKEELEKLRQEKQLKEEEKVNDEETSKELYGHMPDFVKFPNIINGVVVDSNEKLIEDVVVIIKDKSKRIMRAMKSNILGQFYSRNPLLNGVYDIEANKEGFVFETVQIELNGSIMNPIIIRPKRIENKIDAGVNFMLKNTK